MDSYHTTPGRLYGRIATGADGAFTLFDGTELSLSGTDTGWILGVQAGEGVTLITGGGSETAFGRIPVRSKTYIVGAVFEVDNSQYDSSIIFMPYEQAQLFFQSSGATEQIEIRVADPDRFAQYLPPIEAIADGRQMTDWTRIIGPYFEALKIERNVMRLILMLIVAVAALDIITGLVMLVKDKTGDIAV